jgi:membrane protein DedA with SNARE-associated domain
MKEQHGKVEEAALSPTAATLGNGSLWLRIGALALAAIVTVVILAFSDRIEELKALGYIGAFLIMLVGNATVVFPVPGLVFVFAMGSTLNPLLVGLFAGPGAALGELTGYLAGYGGVTPLENTALYRRFDRWMDRFAPLVILLLATVPNPVFDMAGLLAGASHMVWWKFLIYAWIGKTIQAILIALAGAYSLEWVSRFFTA